MPSFARLLLLAWLGWRLYPYAPTIDLHKYWHAIQPLLSAPPPLYDIFRYGVLWLGTLFLLQTAFQPKRPFWLFLAATLCFLAAKIVIVGQSLSATETIGAGAALVLSPLLMRRLERIGIPVLAAVMLVIVILSRLLPWQLAPKIREFHWIPFFSFLHGSLQIDVIAFSEKFWLYGTMLLLLLRVGLPLRMAVVLLSAVLFVTSVMQIFLVARSAEITDALLALGLGLIYALMTRLYSATRSG
jgi:hypothetical protein